MTLKDQVKIGMENRKQNVFLAIARMERLVGEMRACLESDYLVTVEHKLSAINRASEEARYELWIMVGLYQVDWDLE